MTERERFEAWAVARDYPLESAKGKYFFGGTQQSWEAWQASSASSDALVRQMRDALEAVINATHSHVDGRDLLAELHPRHTLDIKRRRDAVETWFEGDWLSGLWHEVKKACAAISAAREHLKEQE